MSLVLLVVPAPGPTLYLAILCCPGSSASLKDNGSVDPCDDAMTSSPPKKPKKEAPQKSNTELEEVKQEVPPTAASEEPTTEVATEEKNSSPRRTYLQERGGRKY